MHKTRNQNTQVMPKKKKKNKGEREKKQQNHLEPFSFHTLEEPFHLVKPWYGGKGEELKSFKFERNMRALKRFPREAKEDGN